ncbi:MAG TPA: YdcF family protein [Chloroflexota bacterium]|nr:YdcF family protein [Chloroflexota bacterium]
MHRSAPRLGHARTAPRATRQLTRPARGSRAAAPVVASGSFAGWLLRLLRVLVGVIVVVAAVLIGPGVFLDTPQPPPQVSDAIVVISGDEQMARFQEGMTLYERGLGQYLVFSGAAYDNGTSNADVMRDLAVKRGVPDRAILEEPLGGDTWGNAIYTRQVLEEHGLRSAILVTSPYHARRAKLTFDAAYAGSGIALGVHAAPDSQWRKLSWWQQPETRRLTFTELQKLAYIFATGQYH